MAELETVARPYAKALFMIAKENPSDAESWDQFLFTLKELIEDEALFGFVQSPEVSAEQKLMLITEVAEGALSRSLTAQEQNFVKVINREKRYDVLPTIYSDFKESLLAEQGIAKVNIQSAYPLTEAQEQMFIEALKRRTNREIELTVTISPSLLGGAILEIDDLVIDGSILGRLSKMTRSMN